MYCRGILYMRQSQIQTSRCFSIKLVMDSISKHSETRVQMFVFRHLSCKIHWEFWKQEFWENICAHVLIFIPFISLWLCTKTWMWYQRRDALSSSFFPSAVNVQVHTNTTNTTTTINTSSKLSHAHADILIMGGRDVEIKTSICFCISCNVSFVMTCSHCGKLTFLLCDWDCVETHSIDPQYEGFLEFSTTKSLKTLKVVRVEHLKL